MLFNGAVCVVHPGSPPPSPAPSKSISGTIESIARGGLCLFAIDGANLNPRQPRERVVRVVDAGKHQVSCRAGGVLQTKTVMVTAGATLEVAFDVGPKPAVPEGLPPHQGAAGGTLIGIAVGGTCQWSVDGKAHGVSASVRLRTTAGAHSIACTSGGTTRTQRVTVSASKPGVATFRIGTTVSSGGGGASGATGPSTRPPVSTEGSLVAIAIGGSCAFAVDGTPRGISSSLRIRVPSGEHRVDCLAGGVAHSQTVVVTPAEPGVATFRLHAARPDGNSR